MSDGFDVVIGDREVRASSLEGVAKLFQQARAQGKTKASEFKVWQASVAGGARKPLSRDEFAQVLKRARELEAVRASRKVIGWERLTDDEACTECLADDGGHSDPDDPLALHPSCGCGALPIVEGEDFEPTSTPAVDHPELGSTLTKVDKPQPIELENFAHFADLDRDMGMDVFEHDAHPERYTIHPKSGYEVRSQVPEPRIITRPPDRYGEGEFPMVQDFRPDNTGFAHPDIATSEPYPLSTVFRAVSEDDYQQAKDKGFLKSDQRMNLSQTEGTVAETGNPSFYLPGKLASDPPGRYEARVLAIDCRREDGWKYDRDGYIKTNSPIPMDRVMASPKIVTDRDERGGTHTRLDVEPPEPHFERVDAAELKPYDVIEIGEDEPLRAVYMPVGGQTVVRTPVEPPTRVPRIRGADVERSRTYETLRELDITPLRGKVTRIGHGLRYDDADRLMRAPVTDHERRSAAARKGWDARRDRQRRQELERGLDPADYANPLVGADADGYLAATQQPRRTHEYPPAPAEVNDLTPYSQEALAVSDFTAWPNWGPSEHLRDGGTLDSMDAADRRRADALNSALRQQKPLEHPIKVWRAVGPLPQDVERQLKPGGVFTDRGWASTACDPTLAEQFASGQLTDSDPAQQRLFVMTVPKGERVLQVEYPEGPDTPGFPPETILRPGRNVRVDSVERRRIDASDPFDYTAPAQTVELPVYHCTVLPEAKREQLPLLRLFPPESPYETTVKRTLRDMLTPDERKLTSHAAPSPLKTGDQVYSRAPQVQREFGQLLDQVAHDLDAGAVIDYPTAVKEAADDPDRIRLTIGPIKHYDRAWAKVRRKYEGNWSQITDIVRGTAITPNPESIETVLAAVRRRARERNWDVVSVEDKVNDPSPAGYRDFSIKLRTPDGFVTELQFNTSDMVEAKDRGHPLYEQQQKIADRALAENRALTADERDTIRQLDDRQQALYAHAWNQSVHRRLLPTDFQEVPADQFADSFEQARRDSKLVRAFTTNYSREDFSQMRCFLAPDGRCGGAIKQTSDGHYELVSVFNNGSMRGSSGPLLERAKQLGVDRLECIGDQLRRLYEKAGFQVTQTYEWDDALAPDDWDYAERGRPPVYAMELEAPARLIEPLDSKGFQIGARRYSDENVGNGVDWAVDARREATVRTYDGREISGQVNRVGGSSLQQNREFEIAGHSILENTDSLQGYTPRYGLDDHVSWSGEGLMVESVDVHADVPPKIKLDADVRKVHTKDQAETYLRRFGSETDLSGMEDWRPRALQELCQAVKDYDRMFPGSGRAFRGIKSEASVDNILDPEAKDAFADGSTWALTTANLEDAVPLPDQRQDSYVVLGTPSKSTLTELAEDAGLRYEDMRSDAYRMPTSANGELSHITETPYGRMLHELGHAWAHSVGVSGQERSAEFLSSSGLTPSDLHKISDYGASSPQESVAEAFCTAFGPQSELDRLDPDLRRKLAVFKHNVQLRYDKTLGAEDAQRERQQQLFPALRTVEREHFQEEWAKARERGATFEPLPDEANRLWWEPGDAGRYLVFADGTVWEWPEYEATHGRKMAVARNQGWPHGKVAARGLIGPDGTVRELPGLGRALQAVDPRVKIRPPNAVVKNDKIVGFQDAGSPEWPTSDVLTGNQVQRGGDRLIDLDAVKQLRKQEIPQLRTRQEPSGLYHVAPRVAATDIEAAGLRPRGPGRPSTFPQYPVTSDVVYAYPSSHDAAQFSDALDRASTTYQIVGVPDDRLVPDHEELDDALNGHFNFSDPGDPALREALGKVNVGGRRLADWWAERVPRDDYGGRRSAAAVDAMPDTARVAAAKVLQRFGRRIGVKGTIAPDNLRRVDPAVPQLATKGRTIDLDAVKQLRDRGEIPQLAIRDYRIAHQAPGEDDGPAWDLEQIAPDIYEHPEWYATGQDEWDRESMKVIRAMRGKPDDLVTVYRSTPVAEINQGDWVTLSPLIARMENAHPTDPSKDMPVYAVQVPVRSLRWDGNSIHEFGYVGPDVKPQRVEADTHEAIPRLATRFPSSHTTVGVTPARPDTPDIPEVYGSAEFKAFEADVSGVAQQFDVQVRSETRVHGVFEGGGERAYAIDVINGDVGIRGFMAELGRRYNQDAVASFRADPEGPDVRYEVTGVDPEHAPAVAAEALGFANVVDDRLDFWGKPEDSDRVADLAGRLGGQVSFTQGYATFIGKDDYAGEVARAEKAGEAGQGGQAEAQRGEAGRDGRGAGKPADGAPEGKA